MSVERDLEMIVAHAGGVVGINGTIPWHIPEDLRLFKEITMGHPIIFGRKTYESMLKIGKMPLPGRTVVVLSKSLGSNAVVDGVRVCSDFESALQECRMVIAAGESMSPIFLGGGASLYNQFGCRCAVVHITEITSESIHLDGGFNSYNSRVLAPGVTYQKLVRKCL